MPYEFDSAAMYRMPAHFGPRTGPRRGPAGERFACQDNPRSEQYAIRFLTDSDKLAALLPPGFSLHDEPVVTLSATYMSEIEWLAGRGYNTLGLTFRARYQGQVDDAAGNFLTVLWENLADPIITGREELGYAKIYCELPMPTVLRGEHRISASWLGFRFLELRIGGLQPASPPSPAQSLPSLHYKYMPRTGEWGVADVAYATMTPAEAPNRRIIKFAIGTGSFAFRRPRWEDMPTQFNIVNALADLPVIELRDASLMVSIGGKDLRDTRILR
ncbi:MAG: acetoacetate decarboxylase family protein [Chloroflexi bacterium]|nr:acetoacetate decarboxylase family protein [Chloroflexota bacterium]MCY3582545.1 acetoacetate decarboxylase family protein [Chloroflexota bacterium]MCY3715297.1 acetoacetate decarboxylase family protein [Chloroflexota bacterium]MDE2650194.1 acetoacetate decarboxylase family protein [Chloroflexota bacterium]MXV92117.1 hypothetical protein [Chloroflexota bacterium]